jgi:hypothetical protein
MSIILSDCTLPTPAERMREYVQRVDPTSPEYRGRVIRGVMLQSRRPWAATSYRVGTPIGSLTPADPDAVFFDPPSPPDLLGPDFTLLSYTDLSQGF